MIVIDNGDDKHELRVNLDSQSYLTPTNKLPNQD